MARRPSGGCYVKTTGIQSFLRENEMQYKRKIKPMMREWAEESAIDFLDIIKGEIRRLKHIDTGRLLESFTKGSEDNYWITSRNGLEITVGTKVPYAKYVNSGHWTTSNGVSQRWVPGYWSGNKFVYDPGAKTGMLLKRKWVEGSYFWESAQQIYQEMFNSDMNKRLEEWLADFKANVR